MNNPAEFWVSASPYAFSDHQYAIIAACLYLERGDAHVQILRRFYCIAIYQLRESQYRIYDASTIARTFHEATGEELEKLKKSIEVILLAGSRYLHIATRLGGHGALFLLGQKIARSM
jgi:hypothetical protein